MECRMCFGRSGFMFVNLIINHLGPFFGFVDDELGEVRRRT
jgi:hypothetical protein